MKILTPYQYWVRVIVIFLATLSPFICILSEGVLGSLSKYWTTELQPLFIVANATTSYYLYSMKQWRLSALMLLLLTAFSVDLFKVTHDILAILFFLLNIRPLRVTNHFKWVLFLYLSSLILLPFGMLWAEIVAIDALCIYHFLLLNRVYKISKNVDN
jgi:hypothetical protein